jgi:hypothetical protein
MGHTPDCEPGASTIDAQWLNQGKPPPHFTAYRAPAANWQIWIRSQANEAFNRPAGLVSPRVQFLTFAAKSSLLKNGLWFDFSTTLVLPRI